MNRRQPMPVLDAMSQPGCQVWLPPQRLGMEARCQDGRRFVEQMLTDDNVRRLWVGAVPDMKSLLPGSLVRKARKAENWTPDTEHSMGQEVLNSLGPQRLPFPELWIEFAVPHAEGDDLAPLAAYVMETGYGYGVAFFRLMDGGSRVHSTTMVEQISVDDQGRVTGMQTEWAVPDDRKLLGEISADDEFSMVHITLPVMWAIGLMNCRNVTTVEVTPRNRSSKKQRRKRKPGLSYHTIVLPTTRIGSNSQTDPSTGRLSDQPLHMVRGHTKTYTADAPLLGRHVGTYWWGYQVRGSKEHGEIVSDYRMTS